MIKREIYMKRIRPFMGTELIKVITGIRRSGKSVMLELIQEELLERGVEKEQIIGINFEQMSNAYLCNAKSLHEEITSRVNEINGKAYLFFDEMQEVKDWEKFINSCRVDFDCDIYITGSNAKLLSGELATYIAGRYVEFVIYPFSFSEFLDMYKQEAMEKNMASAFNDYLVMGGMPSIARFISNKEANYQYLNDIYNSVVLKDIVKRNNIRNVDLLERIIRFLFSNIGHTFSATSITKYFRNENRSVSNDTILNYIKACESAFLFYPVRRQELVGKKILSVNGKVYVADHGLREAVFGGNARDIDQILENIVYMEMLRRGYSVTVGIIGTKEIDFVCEKKGDKLYVQVSYLLASEETVAREFGAYRGIKDNYPKYVVTMDTLDMSRDGIKHCNIKDFLLKEEWK